MELLLSFPGNFQYFSWFTYNHVSEEKAQVVYLIVGIDVLFVQSSDALQGHSMCKKTGTLTQGGRTGIAQW